MSDESKETYQPFKATNRFGHVKFGDREDKLGTEDFFVSRSDPQPIKDSGLPVTIPVTTDAQPSNEFELPGKCTRDYSSDDGYDYEFRNERPVYHALQPVKTPFPFVEKRDVSEDGNEPMEALAKLSSQSPEPEANAENNSNSYRPKSV